MFGVKKKIWIISYKSFNNCREEIAILARNENKAINIFFERFRSKINYSAYKEGEAFFDVRKIDIYE